MIMYVWTFKTDVIVFISYESRDRDYRSSTGRTVIMYVKIFKTDIFTKSHKAVDTTCTLTDILQNQSQYVDANI